MDADYIPTERKKKVSKFAQALNKKKLVFNPGTFLFILLVSISVSDFNSKLIYYYRTENSFNY